MFTSQLLSKIEQYDRYGEYRVNGFKAVFIVEVLFIINFIYTIPNPYFYCFYIPLTAFAAEVVGNSLEDKFRLYFYTVFGSIVAVFLFGIFQPYRIFFIFFVLAFSLLLYWVAIYRLRGFLVSVPLILCLAMYSLIYGSSNTNFYIMLNHALESVAAMVIVMISLLFFPKRYYLWIWHKAFNEVIELSNGYVSQIENGEIVTVHVIHGMVTMRRYAFMLDRRIPIYSILKITLLSFDLVMAISYLSMFQRQLPTEYIKFLAQKLQEFRVLCKSKQVFKLSSLDKQMFQETHELRTLYKIIVSWNKLCLTL